MKHFKKTTVTLAIGAAVLSMTSLPALALDNYSVNGVAVADADSFTNGTGVTVKLVEVLEPMTSITNNGTINGAGSTAALTVAGGAGVGTLTNTGFIESIQTSQSAYAIDIFTDVTGTINNSGDITATLTDHLNTSMASVTALYIGGDITSSGSINNSGNIVAAAHNTGTASTAEAGAKVYGIMLEAAGILGAGAIVNDGNITVTADTLSANALANGITVGSKLEGTITNTLNGVIVVKATNGTLGTGSAATATGIYVGGDVAGTITNDGMLSVTAVAGTSDAYVTGIYAASLSGDIINTGKIMIEASAASSDVRTATGIRVIGSVVTGGQILNSGLISVNIGAADDYAEGAGIYVGGDMAGYIENSHKITLTSTVAGAEETSFSGIHVNTLSGTLTNTNSGVIDVSRTVTSSSSSGLVGIGINTLTGTLNNEGAISVTGTGTSDDATAYGVQVSTLAAGGELNNSGNIIVNGISSAYATGIYISVLNGDVNNSGTISATDDANYGMALKINGGTGTFNNLAGGVVEGYIRVRGAVAVSNAGTIAMRLEQNYITGDYTQTATGVLSIGAQSDTVHGKLDVGGTATFAAGTTINVNAVVGHSLIASSSLLDVVTAGTLSASTFTVTDNSALLNFSAVVDGNTIDLVQGNEQTVVQATAIGSKRAALGAAAVFDTAPAGLVPVTDQLKMLATEKEVADAIESTLPGVSGGMAQVTNIATNAVTGVVSARQDLVRGVASGDGLMTDRHIWFKPFGGWTKQDKRQGVTGYDIDSYGLALGFDGDVSPSWNVGLAFAYINSDVESNSAAGRQAIGMDSYQAKVYATNMLNDVTALNLQAGVGTSNYDSRRHIFTGDIADADYDSWNVQLSAELERSYRVSDKTIVTPYVHADYSYVNVEDYNESGAGLLSLNVDDDSADSLIIGAGVKANYAASDSLLLMTNAGVGYDAMADRSSLTSSFAGGGAQFTTEGIEPDKWVYNAGAGARYRDRKSVV